MPIPKPSLYIDENNSNILIIAVNKDETEYYETKAGIYSFNIDTNEIKMLIEYDKETQPTQHGQIIDTDKILHIMDNFNKNQKI